MNKLNWTALISVFIAAASYGVLSSIVKAAYNQGYSFGQMTGLQLFVGTLILALVIGIFYPRRVRYNLPKTREDFLGIFLMGLTTAGTSIFYYLSVLYLPASIAVLLLMQFSWIGILMEWIFFRSPPTLQAVLSTLVVIFGTVLASGVLSDGGDIAWQGVAFGLGAGCSYALFLLSNGRFMKETPSVYKAGYMAVIASVIFVIFFPIDWINASLFTDPNLIFWGLTIGFFGVVLPPLMLGYGMPKVGVVAGSIISTAELPVALLAAVFIADELVTLIQWIGALIIFLGIIGSKLRRRKKA